jgi:hypothetical protein
VDDLFRGVFSFRHGPLLLPVLSLRTQHLDQKFQVGSLPRPVVFPSVVLLILLEMAVAIAHLLRVKLELFAPVAEILLIVFLILSVVGNLRAPNGPCLCFGAETGEKFGRKVLIRLGAMVVIESLLLWQVVVHSESDEGLIVGNSVDALVVAASTLLLFLWVSSFSDFFFLTRAIRRRFRIGNESRVVVSD